MILIPLLGWGLKGASKSHIFENLNFFNLRNFEKCCADSSVETFVQLSPYTYMLQSFSSILPVSAPVGLSSTRRTNVAFNSNFPLPSTFCHCTCHLLHKTAPNHQKMSAKPFPSCLSTIYSI